VFWVGYSIALLGAFEQANDNGSPIWSSVFGFPVLHHMYYGFFFAAVAWVLFTLLVCCWRIEDKK
jgi:hypothetical protein